IEGLSCHRGRFAWVLLSHHPSGSWTIDRIPDTTTSCYLEESLRPNSRRRQLHYRWGLYRGWFVEEFEHPWLLPLSLPSPALPCLGDRLCPAAMPPSVSDWNPAEWRKTDFPVRATRSDWTRRRQSHSIHTWVRRQS